MTKYAPLGDYLRGCTSTEVSLTFQEIEEIIDNRLPPAAGRHAAWWSNNPSNNVMTRVWLDAGYRSERLDLNARKLVFRRSRKQPPARQPASSGDALHDGRGSPPNILERLKTRLGGTVTFASGFDPTAPTGEVWDAEVS